MKVLKRKFRKKIIKEKEEIKPPKRKLVKIQKPAGRWCEYYSGRLPFPIECSNNKHSPLSMIYTNGVRKITRNTPKCPACNRNPSYASWKRGDWAYIIKKIENGEDLSNMPAPNKEDLTKMDPPKGNDE